MYNFHICLQAMLSLNTFLDAHSTPGYRKALELEDIKEGQEEKKEDKGRRGGAQ